MNRQEEAKDYLDKQFNKIGYSLDLHTRAFSNVLSDTKLITLKIQRMKLFLVVLFILNLFLTAIMFQPVYHRMEFIRTFLKDHINIEADEIKNDIKFNCR